jgi:hypothetical protein
MQHTLVGPVAAGSTPTPPAERRPQPLATADVGLHGIQEGHQVGADRSQAGTLNGQEVVELTLDSRGDVRQPARIGAASSGCRV